MHSLLAFPDSGLLNPSLQRRAGTAVLRPVEERLQEPERRLADSSSPRGFQKAFFERMGLAQQFRLLFEYLPDVDYFAKDVEGRIVAMSPGTLRRIGVQNEEEIIGVYDADIHPPQVAKAIRQDDLYVMKTRQPIIDRVEALYARTRAKDWFLTTKLPLIDAQGEVIGVMGFVRPYHGGGGGASEDLQIQRVVAHIHAHYSDRLMVAELASIAHLSARHLNRRFQETFRMSVQEFIVRTRIQAACDELLATDKVIAEIASASGFYDQSAFTRHFRHHVGETPLVYRRRRQRTRDVKAKV